MIAIKGMEMPKSCSECEFNCKHYEFGDYYSYCRFDKNACQKLHECLRDLLPEDGKASDCPLVEIVTCKDCKHYFIDEDGCGYHCEKSDTERIPTCADFYCIHAERRE